MSHALRAITLAVAVLALAPSARAEIIVKNDSMPPVGVPVVDVPIGWRLGAWLDSPVDGTIVGVQILWGSELGGTAPSQEAAIRISEALAGNYSPGATLATIDSPVLVDGVVNEFRFLDPATGLVPLSVPIAAGARFFVDLEIGSDSFGNNAPGLLMDTDDEVHPEWGFRNLGNQPNNPNPNFWFSVPLALINGGDFGIRAIIQPIPEPGTFWLGVIGMVGLVLAARHRELSRRALGRRAFGPGIG